MGNGQNGLKEDQLKDINIIKDNGLINVYVNPEGRMKVELLRDILKTCRDNKKPVLMVVGVAGTTERIC